MEVGSEIVDKMNTITTTNQSLSLSWFYKHKWYKNKYDDDEKIMNDTIIIMVSEAHTKRRKHDDKESSSS